MNSLRLGFGYPISMKRSELTDKQKLLVPCPICGAAIGVHCQMYSGFGRRNEAHSERKYYAIEVDAQLKQQMLHYMEANAIGTKPTLNP
jgi:hypothetical protein